MNHQERFQKLVHATRYRLLGMMKFDRKYQLALDAFEWGLTLHTGTRNGGAPEYIHQLEIFSHAVCFHHVLVDPWRIYAAIFLHDAVEDEGVALTEVHDRICAEVAADVESLSKEIEGRKVVDYTMDIPFQTYHTSVVKSLDRCNNVASMIGVFKPDRMARYVKETEEVILPLIKESRRKYPYSEPVFENAKLMINHHLHIIHTLGLTHQEGTQL